MIISCPSCTKKYELDAGLIPAHGRKVKCIICQHEWHQRPDLGEKIDHNPRIKQLHDVTVSPDHHRRSWTSIAIAACAAVSVVSIVVALVGFPRHVVTVFPKMAHAYKAIGIEGVTPGEGLALTNLKTRIENKNQHAVIAVEGDVVNTVDHVAYLAPVQITFLSNKAKCPQKDKQGYCILGRHEYALQGLNLLPGEKTHFKTEFPAPKQTVTYVSVEF